MQALLSTDYDAMTENKSFDSRSVAQLLLIKQFVNLREQPVFLTLDAVGNPSGLLKK